MKRLSISEEGAGGLKPGGAGLWQKVLGFGAVLMAAGQMGNAQTNYQQLLSFGGIPDSGDGVRAALCAGTNGWLYGMTYDGGANNSGTLFRIKKDGSQAQTIHSFPTGDFPYGGVVETSTGELWGATSNGGTNDAGLIFKCAKDGGAFAVMHVFPAFKGDGSVPGSSLVIGKDGGLYGTTYEGGVSNLGTVFRLDSVGTSYAVLYSFRGTAGGDGGQPAASLIQGADGALYGTTVAGGSNNFGTVFKVSTQGTGYTVLHHFAGAPNDGRTLYGGLVQANDGYLYGVSCYGGASDMGTIFRVNTNGGNYSVVHSFASGGNGSQPMGGLAIGTNSILYGSTRFGGLAGGGTVFGVNMDGTGYQVLHSFGIDAADGTQPFAALLATSDGALYGSTYWGGAYMSNGISGTLFKMSSAPPSVVISSISPMPAGYLVSFRGGWAGQHYQIQSTTNHSALGWSGVGTNTAAIDGRFQFFDKACTNVPSRFYRCATF